MIISIICMIIGALIAITGIYYARNRNSDGDIEKSSFARVKGELELNE